MSAVLDYGERLVEQIDEPGRRLEFEAALRSAGAPIPLPSRVAWLESRASGSALYFAIRHRDGRPACAVATFVEPRRALPGHLAWRVERFGPHDEATAAAALRAVADSARRAGRVLRCHVEVFSRDAALRAGIGRVAAALGFARTDHPRMYDQTVPLELGMEEATLFGSLHATARRHIRALGKNPVALRPLADPALALQMSALLRETLSRTGGDMQDHDWPSIIDLSNRHPECSRLIGLFREGQSEPGVLLAFAWGRHHGDHVDYHVAASTRAPDVKMPLGYAVVWDLICWANRTGAAWFDFAGITAGSRGSGDPLGGISDFKRYFSEQVATVGEEWILEPHPARARVAAGVSAGAAWARRLLVSPS